MKRLIIPTLITLLLAVSASALPKEEQVVLINPQDALARAVQLRAEVSAHQEMERQLAARAGGSWRERRWRKTMIALCHEYIESATRAANAYDRAAAPERATNNGDVRPDASLPVTSAEYDARAAQYEQEAKERRAEADRHLSMLRWTRNADLQQQPYYGTGGAGQRGRGGTWIETPQRRTARDHCQDIAQQEFELARNADNIAKHYRLRARQLEVKP